MALATELRAGGASWEQIAEKVGRTPRTVRTWPTNYPGPWKKFLRAAEEQQLTEATAESVHTLRRQLRSADEKTGREAAGKLIQLRVALEKTQKSRRTSAKRSRGKADADSIATYLARLDDAELDRLIEELTVDAVSARASAPGAAKS